MSEPPEKSPVLALVLAFAPAAILLTLLGVSAALGKNLAIPLLWTASIVSVGCCFTASFLLFLRKTGWAIAVGVLFLLLNGAISFFLGCVAALKFN
jgi:hypothetical protein